MLFGNLQLEVRMALLGWDPCCQVAGSAAHVGQGDRNTSMQAGERQPTALVLLSAQAALGL